jgi:hypothetical protein
MPLIQPTGFAVELRNYHCISGVVLERVCYGWYLSD